MSAPEIVAPVSTPADVVHAVRMFERDGQAEMHIGVRSETLGTIDVKTTVHDGSVGVSIGVERHEVRSALVSELPGLENTLRERDLRLGEVKFHDMGSTLASEYGNGQRHQSQEFSRPRLPHFIVRRNQFQKVASCLSRWLRPLRGEASAYTCEEEMNVTSATHADTSGSTTPTTSTTSDTSSVFMQLLLAQLQNQDPMSPMDGNQLASQMVQLNLLDEVTQIQQDVAQLGSTPAAGK